MENKSQASRGGSFHLNSSFPQQEREVANEVCGVFRQRLLSLQAYSTLSSLKQSKFMNKQKTSEERDGGYVFSKELH